MTAIFVTSSGTGIGKTYVSALLIRQLQAKGIAFRALKPIQSGYDDQNIAESDAAVLLEAMNESVTPENAARISQWRFKAALSPDMAAQREGASIDFVALINHCLDSAAENDNLLIEGVGGVMVPLTDKHTVLDWMLELKRIQLAPVLVVGSYLGTISHTLTSFEVMKASGILPHLIIVSESEQSPVPLSETMEVISRFVKKVPIIALKRGATMAEAPDLTRYLL